MPFAASDYLKRLASAQHSDYINLYSQLYEFFDQPVTQLTNDGAHYTRAPLVARDTATCSCVQTCQISCQITIPRDTLAIQINAVKNLANAGVEKARQISNYNSRQNGDWKQAQENTMISGANADTQQPYGTDELIKFWLSFSTACGSFNQIAICKDSQKLWYTSKYAREQAIIALNSLTDQCTGNSVTVSPLESIVQGKSHCGIFIDEPVFDIDAKAKDFLQDLKIIWLNKYDPLANTYLAHAMIPLEKPDIICLRDRAMNTSNYDRYAIRLVNMESKANTERMPSATISQIEDAKFTKLYLNKLWFNMENEGVIIDMLCNQRIINFPTQVLRTQLSNYLASNIGDGGGFIQTIMSFDNIKSIFVTFAMPQHPTWFFPVIFKNIDLIIDQCHVIPAAYPALTQDVCGQIFDCFVDLDVVSAPSDLFHSLVFENQSIDDKNHPYGFEGSVIRLPENVFYNTMLYNISKAIKVYYPNQFMLTWKLATDDSFMRGYNSSKIGARTNIQNIKLTPLTHYLCVGIVCIMFDDNPDPQVLTLEVIGEIVGSAIRSD
ncbi:MAG: hypothetical protein EZS28_014013 [Streblomastix strix]|uniref:Uncharacterized protein n=1 Tax=Streblomastix strix TaxID=222440 RepID=A0A5J4W6H1_9EUKA|nr:MAG: hypothetical protein EZS28_014013 [Streblomastix strix]